MYALVLAPAVWVLTGVGLTGDLTARGRDGFAVEAFTGLLLLVLAGTAYGILVLGPISPAGPLLTGVVYLGIALWALLSPAAYGRVWPAEVAKEGFDISRPGYGLAAVLAVPLICTALSARRWEKYEPPVLPIIGQIGRFRGEATAPGMPIAAVQTTVMGLPGYPVTTDPEPTTVLRLQADPTTVLHRAPDDSTTVASSMPEFLAAAFAASQPAKRAGAVETDALVEALEEEATLAGPPPMEERTTTVVLSSDEAAIVTVLSAGAASTRSPDEEASGEDATEPVAGVESVAGVEALAAEPAERVPSPGEEPTELVPASAGTVQPDPGGEHVGVLVLPGPAGLDSGEESTELVLAGAGSVESGPGEESTELVLSPPGDADGDPDAADEEPATIAVDESAEAEPVPLVPAEAGEPTEPLTATEAAESPDDRSRDAEPTGAKPIREVAPPLPDEEITEPVAATEEDAVPAGVADGGDARDGAGDDRVVPAGVADGDDSRVVRLPVGDAGESTQVVRLPAADAGESTQVVRLPVGDAAERTQVVRLPVGDAGERTQVLRFPVPEGAEQTHAIKPSAAGTVETTQVLKFPPRTVEGVAGPGERTRDLSKRDTGDVGGDETQVIRLAGGPMPDDERTQVIRPGLVTRPGERTDVLQFPVPLRADRPGFEGQAPPTHTDRPGTPGDSSPEDGDGPMSIAGAERPNFSEDPTSPIIPPGARPGEETTDATKRSMTVMKMERPADELAEDPTVHIEIPTQRRPPNDEG